MHTPIARQGIKMPIFFLFFALAAAAIGFFFQNGSKSISFPGLGVFSWIYLTGFGITHILISIGIFYSEKPSFKMLTDFKSLKWLPILVLVGTIFLNDSTFEFFFVILISLHVVGQASGILKLWKAHFAHTFYFKILAIIPIFCSFTFIFSSHLKNMFFTELEIIFQVSTSAFIFYFLYCLFTTKVKNTWEFLLFVLTGIYLLSIAYFGYAQNYFFWVLIFMFGHDLIANGFYWNYFQNRFSSSLKVAILTALSFVLLSGGLVAVSSQQNWLHAVMFFQIIHYIIESFIWKKNSYFRTFISVDKNQVFQQ